MFVKQWFGITPPHATDSNDPKQYNMQLRPCDAI